MLGFHSESSYDIIPVAYIDANSPGIFVEKCYISSFQFPKAVLLFIYSSPE
jgi:hypothetical protein